MDQRFPRVCFCPSSARGAAPGSLQVPAARPACPADSALKQQKLANLPTLVCPGVSNTLDSFRMPLIILSLIVHGVSFGTYVQASLVDKEPAVFQASASADAVIAPWLWIFSFFSTSSSSSVLKLDIGDALNLKLKLNSLHCMDCQHIFQRHWCVDLNWSLPFMTSSCK